MNDEPNASSLGVIVGMSAEARMLRRAGCAVAIGGGSVLGARRMAHSLVDDGATALISFGLAGGLDPALGPGTLVVPQTVLSNGHTYVCDPALRAALDGKSIPALVGAESAITTSAEKRRLWQETGAGAVDLESGAVAEVATAAGIPFAVIRAICDPAGRDVPCAATAALDAGGRIALQKMMAILVRHPGEILGLALLAKDAARARGSLVRGAEGLRRLASGDANLRGLTP